MSAVNEFFLIVMAHFVGFCALYGVFEFCLERFVFGNHKGGRK